MHGLIPSFVDGNPYNVLLYLVHSYFNRFGKLYGRKKIQKPVFLLEYTYWGRKIVGKHNITGYTFTVWLHGPYSRDLQGDLELLIDSELVDEDVIVSESAPNIRRNKAILVVEVKMLWSLRDLPIYIGDFSEKLYRILPAIYSRSMGLVLFHLHFTKDLINQYIDCVNSISSIIESIL